MVTQAAMLHYEAVRIHPFLNGNGRWSRALANIWLFKNSGRYTRWPEDYVGTISPVRDRYIAALKKADQGDIQDLIALHEEFTTHEDEDR